MGASGVGYYKIKGFPSDSVVKNLPAMQEMQVQSLGGEDPLEEGMVALATQCSILAWGIPCTEEPCGIQSMGSQRVEHNWSNLAHTEINTLSITVEITGFNDSWHWIQVRGQFVSVLYQLRKKWILETKSGLGTQTIKQFTLVEKVVYLKFY